MKPTDSAAAAEPGSALPASTEGMPQLHCSGPIATLCLRRPTQRNRLTDDDLLRLLTQLAQVNTDPDIRLLVLTADTSGQRKPVFCAGYDIAGFDSDTHDPLLFERVADALEALRPVTLCALNGSVYGGATDLVLACDLRIGLAGCEFRMPAAALGLHYYPGGLRRYATRLGANLAKCAFLTAQALPFEALQAASLFVSLTDAASFDAEVQALAEAIAQLAPRALQHTKQSLNELAAGGFDDIALRDRETASLNSADFAEGRSAFVERRPARFTGR